MVKWAISIVDETDCDPCEFFDYVAYMFNSRDEYPFANNLFQGQYEVSSAALIDTEESLTWGTTLIHPLHGDGCLTLQELWRRARVNITYRDDLLFNLKRGLHEYYHNYWGEAPVYKGSPVIEAYQDDCQI